MRSVPFLSLTHSVVHRWIYTVVRCVSTTRRNWSHEWNDWKRDPWKLEVKAIVQKGGRHTMLSAWVLTNHWSMLNYSFDWAIRWCRLVPIHQRPWCECCDTEKRRFCVSQYKWRLTCRTLAEDDGVSKCACSAPVLRTLFIVELLWDYETFDALWRLLVHILSIHTWIIS